MDKLSKPVPQFYLGVKHRPKNFHDLDSAGQLLMHEACKRKQIQEAIKGGSYLRRVSTEDYVTRSKDGKQMYLSNFEQLGPRWVKDADDVATRMRHKGWCTDEEGWSGETLIGVVLCFTRHGEGTSEDYEDRGGGRKIYMAGTRHAEWEGVTLDLDITDDPITAARWADGMAERDAEVYREEDAKNRREQKVDDLRENISAAKAACLKLLRDMRPIRKGLSVFPESVCAELRRSVGNYLEEIAGYREEIGELL
jgi:hypothetical protein